jgi:hypothetical protein
MMPRLQDLPAEVLTQVMCECEDIMTVLRMSSTCHKLREIWLDNISSIVRAVFEFTRWELLEYLKLAIVEEPSSPPQPYQSLANLDEIAFAVRHHLAWLERSAFAISALRKKWAEQTEDRASRNLYVPEIPDFHDYLSVRRLVVGFDHPKILSAAYASIQSMSDEQLGSVVSVGETVDGLVRGDLEHIGIDLQYAYPAEWEPDALPNDTDLPHTWAFAIYAVQMESNWRPTTTLYLSHELAILEQYSSFRDFFGSEKMVAMYGEDRCPYIEARRDAREIWRREHPDDPDGKKNWMEVMVSAWRSV